MTRLTPSHSAAIAASEGGSSMRQGSLPAIPSHHVSPPLYHSHLLSARLHKISSLTCTVGAYLYDKQLNITRLTLRHRVIVGSFTSVSTTSGGKMMQASSLVWPCKAFLFVKGRFFPPSEQSTYAKDVVRWGDSLHFTQTAVNMLHCWSAADGSEQR
jgi:hypothetical protein